MRIKNQAGNSNKWIKKSQQQEAPQSDNPESVPICISLATLSWCACLLHATAPTARCGHDSFLAEPLLCGCKGNGLFRWSKERRADQVHQCAGKGRREGGNVLDPWWKDYALSRWWDVDGDWWKNRATSLVPVATCLHQHAALARKRGMEWTCSQVAIHYRQKGTHSFKWTLLSTNPRSWRASTNLEGWRASAILWLSTVK